MSIAFLEQRWKAIAALVGSVATALLVILPGNTGLQVVISIVGALLTGGVVHQVSNAVPGTLATAETAVGTITATATGTADATGSAVTDIAETAVDVAADVVEQATGRRRKK